MASGGFGIPFKAKCSIGLCGDQTTDAESLLLACKDCLKRTANPNGTISSSECKENSQEVSIGEQGFQLEAQSGQCAICMKQVKSGTRSLTLPCTHSLCVACVADLNRDTQGIVCKHCKAEHMRPSLEVYIGKSIATRSKKGEPLKLLGNNHGNFQDVFLRSESQNGWYNNTLTRIKVRPYHTVSDLQEIVRTKTGIHPGQQFIYHVETQTPLCGHGVYTPTSTTLASCKVKHGSMLTYSAAVAAVY